jgi:hypothetical protein
MFTNQQVRKNSWVNCHLQAIAAGDILLFRPSKKLPYSQKLIMFCQSLLHKKHGHYDTVHAAICTGQNDQNQPMIAHVTVVPGQKGAYYHEPLQTMLDREDGDRPFMIFRPQNTLMAQSIGQFAKDVSAAEKFKWSVFSAATSLTYCPRFHFGSKPAIKTISSDTFCSRFVIQVMKKASQHLSLNAEFDDISERSTPKALESFLSKRDDYQKLCYLGKTPYQDVLHEVQIQLTRLSTQKSKLAREKFSRAENAFRDSMAFIERNQQLAEGEKVRYLFNTMLPIFKENTGWNLSTARSYSSLAGLARNMGIFKKDIQSVQTPREDQSHYIRLAR